MRFLNIFLKLVMLVGTVGVALGAIWLGLLTSSPTGFFGAPQSDEVRFGGYVLLAIGIVMMIFSFSILKRNNLIPFLIEIFTVIIGVLVRSIPYGPGQDVVNIVFPYLIGMGILYLISHQLDKKTPEQTSPQAKQKAKKINMILFGIPIILLMIGWWYINYGHYFNEQREGTSTQKTKIGNFEYHIFSPKYIPKGYKLYETRLGGIHGDYFYSEYRNNQQENFIIAQFEKPTTISLNPPKCYISGNSFEIIDGSSFSSYVNSDCEEIQTPKGLKVFTMTYNITSRKYIAAIIREDTLVTVSGYKFSESELIKLFDSLEVKSPQIKAPNMKNYE